MRINEEELSLLENLMDKTHKTVSNTMREAIEFFAAHYEQTSANSPAA
jgi:predicted DNA-binding protein